MKNLRFSELQIELNYGTMKLERVTSCNKKLLGILTERVTWKTEANRNGPGTRAKKDQKCMTFRTLVSNEYGVYSGYHTPVQSSDKLVCVIRCHG